MSYSNKTILTVSDELTFIQSFIDSLVSEDERIVCTTTDLAEQFNNAGQIPAFRIVIADSAVITFTRSTVISAGTHYYQAVIENGNGQLSLANLMINGTGSTGDGKDTVTNRSFKYTVITNDNAVCLMLGGYDTAMPGNALEKVLICKSSDDTYCTSVNGSSFYDANGTSATVFTRLGYTKNGQDITELDIIRNKISVQPGTSVYHTTLKGIYDCTTLSLVNYPIRIDNSRYFGIDSHTIIPC